MKTRSLPVISRILCCLIGVSLVVPAAAQQRRPKGPPIKKASLRTEGTVKAVGRGLLQLTAKDGGQWLISMPEDPNNVVVQGSADASWLQRGMLVRFTAPFDKKGKAESHISELAVFSPREGYKIGVFPDSNLGGSNLGGKFFGDDEAKKKAKLKANKPPKPSQSANYLVAGRLVSVKNGKMTIAAGRTSVRAQLAEKVVIRVEVSDYRVAREGDKVEIDAWYPEGQQAGRRAVANRVTITLAKPLAAPTRPRPKSARGKSKAAKPKPNEDKPNEGKPGEAKPEAKSGEAKSTKLEKTDKQ